MKNLKRLFKALPEIGWGDSKDYTGTCQDIHEAVCILNGGIEINLIRITYLKHCKSNKVKPLSTKLWLKEKIYRKDNYISSLYMNGFEFKDGEFLLNTTEKGLDVLASTYLKYNITHETN